MDCIAQRIPYRQTGYFTHIVLDYIDQAEQLKSFFAYPPTLRGIQKSIESRKQFATNRHVLVQELKEQYELVDHDNAVTRNIELLLSEDTFTLCTAHQPNIFTGHLFFIYKIIHAIKLASYLNTSLPAYHFIPVFYMGSEDADLDELGHTYLNGEKMEWKTRQTGAVGRMKVDKELLTLIQLMEGQLSVQPYGKEIIDLIKECYKIGNDIQTSTFKLVNALFGKYGLVVLIPDNAVLKKQMISVFEDDLFRQTASGIVEKTSQQLAELYKIQARPREINLFYLKDDIRERIVMKDTRYKVQGTSFQFTQEELIKELHDYPDRFSPNVILRGLYQETILPNIAFIGGGGELAYWLQLKSLFAHYKVPFPVLLLRNSFLIVEKKWQDKISKLQLAIEEFFQPEQQLINKLVARESKHKLTLNGTLSETEHLYELIKKQATSIDVSLEKHVDALKTRTLERLHKLEKKMLRAEKRKFNDQQRHIHSIKERLFPKNSLQERVDNFIPYYAKWGEDFIQRLYEHSLNLEQEFVILAEP